jgi:ABC-type multidrug transport system ATPase subunit
MAALLDIDRLTKVYRPHRFARPSFALDATLSFDAPAIIGVLGPNGSGKTTLFELITGLNQPTSGEVRVRGQAIHRVKRSQRGQLARHYHQSYQIRRFHEWTPELFQHRATLDEAAVHLFDEPQLNTQDGYIGFMLRFFRRLRSEGKLVFVCLHPNERWQLDLLRELSERFLFVHRGGVSEYTDFGTLAARHEAREYGTLLADREACAASAHGHNLKTRWSF